MILASPFKYLSILKREIRQKLLSHNCESAGWLAKYGIAKDSKPWGIHVLLINILWGSSVSLTTLAVFVESFIPFFKDVSEREELSILLILTCSA